MTGNNLLIIPAYFPSGITIEGYKTAPSIELNLAQSNVPIPAGAKALTGWIAVINGSGYAEMIWTINGITSDFKVSLFIHNTTEDPITPSGPPSQGGKLMITFVVMYDLPQYL